MRLFVYGTLLDAALRARVIGRAIAGSGAWLPGYRRIRATRRPYPVLVAAPGAAVAGLVLSGLRVPELARLRGYEGEEYVLAPAWAVPRRGGRIAVAVFLPHPEGGLSGSGLGGGAEGWSLAWWRRRFRAHALAEAGRGRRRQAIPGWR